MARNYNAWFKLHRKIFLTYEGDAACGYILMLLISWANIEDGKDVLRKQLVKLKRGQLPVSYREISHQTGFSKNVVERVMKKLEEADTIRTQKGHRGTIVTICNYEKYQGTDDKKGTQTRHKTRHNQDTIRDTIRDTNQTLQGTTERSKEIKKERRKEVGNIFDITHAGACEADHTVEPQKDHTVEHPKAAKIRGASSKDEQPGEPEGGKKTHALISHYCEVYKDRYTINPPINGKATGVMSRLGKDFSLDKGKKLISTFLTMNDQFFIAKAHDLATFENNLNKIQVTAETGKQITREQAQKIERRSGLANVIQNCIENHKNGEKNGVI